MHGEWKCSLWEVRDGRLEDTALRSRGLGLFVLALLFIRSAVDVGTTCMYACMFVAVQ